MHNLSLHQEPRARESGPPSEAREGRVRPGRELEALPPRLQALREVS